MHLVISCNLKPHSRTRILARQAFDTVCELNQPADLIDLQDYAAFIEQGDADNPAAAELTAKIAAADSVLLATPIYHFDAGATTKQLIELTPKAWRRKVIGLLGTAADRRSHMALLGLANGLMLEFRCLIVPYFVIATPKSFDGDILTDRHTIGRLDDLAEAACQWGAAAAAIRGSRQIRGPH